MVLFKNQFLNNLFVLLIFSVILLSLNERITAFIHGKPQPPRRLQKMFDNYFEK
jgi:uncharacterized membrane protein